jgi:hypothetical protein
MKMTIKSFSVLRTAKIVAFVQFIITAITAPVFLVGPETHPLLKLPIHLIGFAVLVFAVGMFVLAAVACLLYNLLAKYVGGVEFTVEEKPEHVGPP